MSENKQILPYSVSQNFLTDGKTIDKLLNLTNIDKTDSIIEIGAGKGHITKALVERSGNVTATEIDEKLYMKLVERMKGYRNLTLLNKDFLETDLPSSGYKVFANIPFSATTAIIRKLTDSKNPPAEAWLVVQEGAAKRFCGKPNENLNSLALKPFFELKTVYCFNRNDFHPAPSVDAVLLYIKRKESPDLAFAEQRKFKSFLEYNIKHGLCQLTKKQAATALRLADLPQIERSGLMLYVQWLCLFRCFKQFNAR